MESVFHRAVDNNPMSISEKFIVPEEHKANLSQVSTQASIPIIDLSITDHNLLVHKITQACEEYGFFQITNHGVPKDLCKKTMTAVADFYSLPSQERSQFTDTTKPVKIIGYLLNSKDQESPNIALWSESLNHPWDPAGDFASLLPQNPPQYRETFAEYAKEVMSNGRLKSVHHRVVNNKMQQRISVAFFYGPNMETVIGPIEELTNEEHPPLYRTYTCTEFMEEYKRQAGKRPMVKEAFQLTSK
ncbi:hypothetical protein F8388_005927 [Cannabis sativa]|uniref:Uncharacterized protein n=1 Tax=Cannabis sativa TaxID=3483 RepID=A0A7J6E367_CANSA|nr:hypothetical protein F8388_005927 [Cannabis sativa]KAF4404628.1 hypothetical protein G4B88_006014 [Cannabis sativa]